MGPRRKGKWTRWEGESTVVAERPGRGENERFIVSKSKDSEYHVTTILRDSPEYMGKPMTGRYAEVVDIHVTNERTGERRSVKDKMFWVA